MKRITILAGGVGGARFVRGARTLAQATGAEITVVANTGDDLWLTGLRVCPDLDSIMYSLGGANDTERGWGRAGESERVSAELTAYGVGWPWFTLGDLDLGTHIARTALLREGLTLTEVTQRLCLRWNPGVRLLPATNDEVETHVEIVDGSGRTQLIHFEEWWVRHRGNVPTRRFVHRGIESSSPAPEAVEAILSADVVLLAPSNPVVSVGTIIALPGMAAALRTTAAPVIAVSPIIGGSPVRGMADICLGVIGVDVSAAAVGQHYGARTQGGLLDGWLVDPVDAGDLPLLERAGIPARSLPLWMNTDEDSAAIVAGALQLAGEVREP
ncbi:2-phospho-L-lactate transferase [Arthrobacter sp. zg-Y238]|uniref:2-phospho-L-lactate transferase n=1 Tax=Arthrobacter sp. zg-Y238 TaxID=2964614 RepID=UPI002102ABC0|nr:2-phospho-L-lactate transferase [Arthrobacter sp. zg-Y238]MCQ1952094.1 2-phospho-L-lactate transferase [Arthrobacter sp. zg-Y238]